MKWRALWSGGLALGLAITLTACGGEQSSSSSGGQGGYKEMKTMVVDILKSDEGKKAVEEALSTPSSDEGGGGSGGVSMKMMPMQTTEQVRIAVKDTLTAPEYQKEIEKS